MVADSLHALNVLSEALVEKVGILLARLSILNVTLPVQHPGWDFELQRVADHGYDLVDLIGGELPCALVQIDVAFFANDIREAATNTFDCGRCVHNLLTPIDVGVTHTQNMLEISGLELN